MKIELSGGIGNQLFQYSFGKYIERKYDLEVTYVFAPHGVGEAIHKSNLKDFHFGDNLILKNRNLISATIARIDRYMMNKLPIYRKFLIHYFQRYSQIGTGFDQGFTKVENLHAMRGYFQSYVYPQETRVELVSGFQLKAASKEFRDYEKEANAIRPIMLHLRRGDYMKLSNTVGILGVDYYFNAIKALLTSNPDSEVWIFSDDSHESSLMQSQLESKGITDMKSGFALSDSETLMLMSLGAGIVIANSTFSWWAAFLGNYSNNVVAPLKWYKNLPDPAGLIPENWTLIESYWEPNKPGKTFETL